MAQTVRIFWGIKRRSGRYNLQWSDITHESVVVVTASEGPPPITTVEPNRFVGDARFTVCNVAPHEGGVTFRVIIDWFEPLNLWTDVTLFDKKQIDTVILPFPPPG